MNLHLSRRELLKALAIASAVLHTPSLAWAQRKFEKNPFLLGVASGSPTDQSIVLWTRLVDDGLLGGLPNEAIEVKWELASDEKFTNLVKSGVSVALPELAHSVHAEVSQLPSNQWFYYRFKAGDMVSPIGRTRTLPAPNEAVNRLRLAYASCQHYEHGYFGAYEHMRHEELDLVMFLGDYIYEYGQGKSGVRAHNSGPLITLDDYRKRYVLYKKDVNLQLMHATCPWLMTWDDHEVQNDYAGLTPGTFGPYVSDFPKRRAAAYQAYYEHMPIRSSALIDGLDGLLKGSEMRIYGDFRFGKLANISVLDDRQYRDVEVCTPSGVGSAAINPKKCPELGNPNRSMLGATQENWLANILRDSDKSIWNVIGQPTLFAQRYFPSGETLLVWSDGWDGYPEARKRLNQQFVKNKVKNLVIFGGDVHENWVGYIKEDYDNKNSSTLGVEFCGTSISTIGGGAKYLESRLAKNPHFIFAEATKKGYGVAEFTPRELVVTLRVVGSADEEKSTIETLAKFKVEAGTNKITRIN